MCIFDRFDSRMASEDRKSSQFLSCWVWMERPDALPWAVEYWYFAAKAGQAMELLGLPSPNRVPIMPPIGKYCEQVVLVHLVGYEDWIPRSPGSSSSEASSEQGSSSAASVFIPFDWAPGVLDGHPTHTRPLIPQYDGCKARAAPLPRCDRDPNDDYHGHRRHQYVPRSSRVRQWFLGCASDRSVRVPSCSPHPYRRAAGVQDSEYVERDRTMSCSPRGGLATTFRTPLKIGSIVACGRRIAATLAHVGQPGGPGPHCCWLGFTTTESTEVHEDPMVLEASFSDANGETAIGHCYSSDGSDVAPASPRYAPISDLWPGNRQST